jgi:hypothetical protein
MNIIDNMPDSLYSYYNNPESATPTKAQKKGSSTIIVHTDARERHVWKKKGKLWFIESNSKVPKKERRRTHPSSGRPPLRQHMGQQEPVTRTPWGQEI